MSQARSIRTSSQTKKTSELASTSIKENDDGCKNSDWNRTRGASISFTGFEYASAEQEVKAVEAGTFHGKVHMTSGRATIHKEADGRLVLRLTNFKTSNGPDVHVVLIAAKDADDDANFLKNSTEKLELGALKGNEGDQKYDIPAGANLDKFQTVSIYCERFNANFGAAPLKKL